MSRIKLHRQIEDNPLRFSEPFTRAQAWIDLLLLTNHDYGIFYVRGNKVEVPRGSVGRSEKTFQERWKWSRSKVRKFLADLEKSGNLIQQKNSFCSTYIIANWDMYQTTERQQKDNRKTTERQQKDNRKTTEKHIQEEKKKRRIEEKEEKNFEGGTESPDVQDPFDVAIESSTEVQQPKPTPKPNVKFIIDGMIKTFKEKCDGRKIIYDPKDERRFAYHMLSQNWTDLASKHGFSSGINFALAILDMSMDTDSRRRYKCNGFKFLYQNYAKIIAEFQSVQEKRERKQVNKPKSF